MKSPADIVNEMLETDTYSNWLGIRILEVEAGYCKLSMQVRADMLNGHGIIHGGISYAISDSALAFASNSRGQKCVSIETDIAHIAPIFLDDELTVTCSEIQVGRSLGRYESRVYNQNQKLVARFNGTVFRKEETW